MGPASKTLMTLGQFEGGSQPFALMLLDLPRAAPVYGLDDLPCGPGEWGWAGSQAWKAPPPHKIGSWGLRIQEMLPPLSGGMCVGSQHRPCLSGQPSPASLTRTGVTTGQGRERAASRASALPKQRASTALRKAPDPFWGRSEVSLQPGALGGPCLDGQMGRRPRTHYPIPTLLARRLGQNNHGQTSFPPDPPFFAFSSTRVPFPTAFVSPTPLFLLSLPGKMGWGRGRALIPIIPLPRGRRLTADTSVKCARSEHELKLPGVWSCPVTEGQCSHRGGPGRDQQDPLPSTCPL